MSSIRRNSSVPVLAILFLVTIGLVHGIAILNPFYFDDFLLLQSNAWLNGLTHPTFWFQSLYLDSGEIFDGWRPILMNSFFLNSIVFGNEAWSFRLGNLVLHFLNTFLLFQILSHLNSRKDNQLLPFFIALIFALHPIQTIGINFLWKRSTILLATFVFSSLLIQVFANQGKIRWKWAIPAQILIYLLALGTKESGGILPLLLILLDLVSKPAKSFLKRRETWFLYLPLFLIAVGFLSFRMHFISSEVSAQTTYLRDFRSLSRMEYFWTSLTVLPRYLGLLFFPQPRVLDDPLSASEFPYLAAIFMGALVFTSLWAGLKWRREKWIPLGLGLIWIPLIPTTTFFTIRFSMDQIRLYLPIAGFSILLAYCLDQLLSRTRISKRAIFFLFAASYGFASILQNQAYSDPKLIWQDVIEEYPHSEVAYAELGRTFRMEGNHKEAASAFYKAYELAPEHPIFLVNSWLDLQLMGANLRKIRTEILVVDMNRLTTMGKIDHALVLSNIDEDQSAINILIDLTKKKPRLSEAHLYLGLIFEKLGQKENARKAFRNTLALNPKNKWARNSLQKPR